MVDYSPHPGQTTAYNRLKSIDVPASIRTEYDTRFFFKADAV